MKDFVFRSIQHRRRLPSARFRGAVPLSGRGRRRPRRARGALARGVGGPRLPPDRRGARQPCRRRRPACAPRAQPGASATAPRSSPHEGRRLHRRGRQRGRPARGSPRPGAGRGGRARPRPLCGPESRRRAAARGPLSGASGLRRATSRGSRCRDGRGLRRAGHGLEARRPRLRPGRRRRHGRPRAVHERCVARVPDRLDEREAAAVPEAFITAHDAVVARRACARARRCSYTAPPAASGRPRCRSASRRAPASSRSCARTAAERRCARSVPSRSGTRASPPRSWSDRGAGADVVLELVGAPHFPGNLEALAPKGRIVIVGVGAGHEVDVPLLALMGKRATLRGTVLRARPLEEKGTAVTGVRARGRSGTRHRTDAPARRLRLPAPRRSTRPSIGSPAPASSARC